MGSLSLIDVLGATIIGAILLLSMLSATYHVQAMSLNIRMYVNLFDISDNTISIVEAYLSKVGFGLPAGTTAILAATPDSVLFRAKLSLLDSTYTTLSLVQGDSIADKGYPFQLKRNGVRELGPFYLSDKMILTYYDENVDATTDPPDIRSVKCEMEFFYKTSGKFDTKQYKNRITFWKYFKNLYLQN